MRSRLLALVRRPEAALFALVLGAVAYFYQAGGWNQNSRFDLTRAVVERGTVRIDGYEHNTGDHARRDGHFYCDKAPGVSFIAVPIYALSRAVAAPAAGQRPTPRFLAISSWIATVWTVGVPSAVAAVLLAGLLGRLGLSPPARLAGAAAWALASLALPYATLFYGHQLVAALLVIAFALLVRARQDGAGPATLATVGFVLGAAVAVEYPAALGALVLGTYALAFVRPLHRVLWIAAGAAVPGAALALYHAIAFGSPLALPYEFSTQPHRHLGVFMGLGAPRPEALLHILVTPYRGIFYSMPWLALAIPGAVVLVRRGARAEAMVGGAIVLLFVWLNASLVDWEGGWAMGARYLVPAIPFLAILAAGVLGPLGRRELRLAGRVVFGATAAWALALMLVGTAVKPEVPVTIRRPFSAYLFPAFARGEVAVNTQSIDRKVPSRVGPRHASNLGLALGLRGLASLLPLALWSAGCAAWLTVCLRRQRD